MMFPECYTAQKLYADLVRVFFLEGGFFTPATMALHGSAQPYFFFFSSMKAHFIYKLTRQSETKFVQGSQLART